MNYELKKPPSPSRGREHIQSKDSHLRSTPAEARYRLRTGLVAAVGATVATRLAALLTGDPAHRVLGKLEAHVLQHRGRMKSASSCMVMNFLS